ncbi:MAG: ParB N-terminal domain-containing protein [Paludibacteraceae bacterium]|nr:ParB N-terminal domain-containing protein [Bacteroidales bacterium]MBQ5778847.1 ParB N-terminal domain-containing protein [Paludibacteraceae bacterium]
MEQKVIKIADLEVNRGQIDGLPKNPRTIKDERFKALKKSIEDAPEMLALRELLVFPHKGKFVVIGGNMRLRVCKELGYKELPCKVIDENTPVEKLREYTIKDNIGFGVDDWGALFDDWNTGELADWGLEFPQNLNVEEETEPTDLDGEQKNKPFIYKMTFENDDKLNEFRQKYEALIQDEFKVIISISGGEL